MLLIVLFIASLLFIFWHNQKKVKSKIEVIYVNEPCIFEPIAYDDPDTMKAQMSCGHAVTRENLTGWFRSQIDQGQTEFRCPGRDNDKCGKIWSYTEIRTIAELTDQEWSDFEERLPRLAAPKYCEFKACPGCESLVEREDLNNLSVHCRVCTVKTGRTFEFCWQCLKTWKGCAPRSDRCENEGCVNLDVDKLANCNSITLSQVTTQQGIAVKCPSLRACPTCGLILEHDGSKCKMMLCPRCKKEFCFLCLKLKEDCFKSLQRWFDLCTVAPAQTSIPLWAR